MKQSTIIARDILNKLNADGVPLETIIELPYALFNEISSARIVLKESKIIKCDTFGETLKRARRSMRMPQKEFCKLIDISLNTLINYENGHTTPTQKKQEEILNAIRRGE